jgi:thioester reductase-like protein
MGDDVVLITGFPRLGARKLLMHVLEVEPGARVAMVVLPKLVAEAAAWIEALPAVERLRITVLEGDAAAMDLGLSGREWKELAAAVTRIHHLAHVSYVGADRATAHHVNVHGAIEIVELARNAPRLACLVHHSTAHVSGDRKGVVREEELDEGQAYHSPMQETRMIAEKVMRRAMADLPVAVVRPTMLVGDSGTGEVERLDGPYLLAMLVLGMPGDFSLPLPSPGDNPLDIVPVDYVVRAAHAIGRSPEARGKTFHLASHEELTARQVFDLIAHAGGRKVSTKSVLPTQVASAILRRAPGIERLVQEPRAFLQQLSVTARYDTRNARAILEPAGISCPPLASYVDTWVKAVQDHWRTAAS